MPPLRQVVYDNARKTVKIVVAIILKNGKKRYRALGLPQDREGPLPGPPVLLSAEVAPAEVGPRGLGSFQGS